MSEEIPETETVEVGLTEKQRAEIKKLALAHAELLWIIIEQLLEESGKSDEILRSALSQWAT